VPLCVFMCAWVCVCVSQAVSLFFVEERLRQKVHPPSHLFCLCLYISSCVNGRLPLFFVEERHRQKVRPPSYLFVVAYFAYQKPVQNTMSSDTRTHILTRAGAQRQTDRHSLAHEHAIFILPRSLSRSRSLSLSLSRSLLEKRSLSLSFWRSLLEKHIPARVECVHSLSQSTLLPELVS
jgi:hypothetical protein